MEPILEARDLTFSYPGQEPCLQGVSLAVRPGESVVLLGANGSGKSTLLFLLDGLYFPSSGTVRAFGAELSPQAVERAPFGPRFRREVGFLFQNSEAQLFSATVEEELAFGPLQAGWGRDEIETRISGALDLLDIAKLRRRPPGRLSSGEKKKVALASLLVLSPSVLLLDEPTAGLDPRSQSALLETLEALHERGMALVTATHDLVLAPHLADRALVLSPDHRVEAEGPTQSILEDTALLLRVNLVHAHSHRHGEIVHAHPHEHLVGHRHVHGADSSPDHGHRHGEPSGS
jgi:cobalt/nickel transport system ATP-binding protein